MHLARHSRELWEAALGDDSLQHQLAMLGGGGREDRPHVGDGFLIGCREAVEFTLDESHLGLVGGAAALGIGAMAVAELAVRVSLPDGRGRVRVDADKLPAFAYGCVKAGDVFLEKGADSLANECRGHLDKSGVDLLVGAGSIAVVFGGLVLGMVLVAGVGQPHKR